MGSSLIALVLASVFAALTIVLFRSPRREQPENSIRSIAKTAPEKPLIDPAVPFSTEAMGERTTLPVTDTADLEDTAIAPKLSIDSIPAPDPSFESTLIEDPWGAESTLTSDATATTVSQKETGSSVEMPLSDASDLGLPVNDPMSGSGLPATIGLDHPTAVVPEEADDLISNQIPATTPDADMTASTNPAPFTRGSNQVEGITSPLLASIHDSRRPSTPALQDLSQEILAWGDSRQLSQIPKLLQYVNYGDSTIRGYVALALGKIARPHTVKSEIEWVIPALGKLSQDSDPKVRLFAVQALGGIQSPKVLPYLEQALLNPTGSVMKAANSALQKLNLKPDSQSTATLDKVNSPKIK